MARRRRRKRNSNHRNMQHRYHDRDRHWRTGIPLHDTPSVAEDHREFHPKSENRAFKTTYGANVRFTDTVLEGSREWDQSVGSRYFLNPDTVQLCKNRRKRRESLFAARKVGKGIRVSTRRRYTEKSKVRCK